jgi:predicted nucleotidyltransferase
MPNQLFYGDNLDGRPMPPTLYTKQGNLDFLRELDRNGASFLLIGGAAVAAHGCRNPFEVDDLDVLIDPRPENVGRVIEALVSSGFQAFPTSYLAKPAVHASLKKLHLWLDLLTPREGENYPELLERSVPAKIDGLTVRVMGRDDLIAMKMRALAESETDAAKHRRDLERLQAI